MSYNTDQIFGQGVKRTKGEQSRRYNLLAARLIAELVKNFLGPRGMEKMFIDVLGEVTVTKDGATLLRKIDVEHPAAKVLIEASNAVDNEVGDGTTSVVVLAGALVEKAEELLDMGIKPATIVDGYLTGLQICLESLQKIAKRFRNCDRDVILGLAITCLRPKMISYISFEEKMIAKLVADATYAVADFANSRIEVNDIKIEEKIGNTMDTMLVNGVVIDKTIDNSAMPRAVENAKVLLIDEELEGKRTRIDAEISINSPHQMQSFLDKEQLLTTLKVRRIIRSGANVVISQKGINALAQNHLSRAGIISIRRVKENDMLWLKKATNAKMIRDLSNGDLPIEDLGYAEKVYEKFVGDDKMVFVEGCRNPKSVTILLRATSKRLLDEYHRSVLDVFSVIRNFIVKPCIVGGGGSSEMLLASIVRKKANSISSREQVVLQKFAAALEEIPLTIARNAGMNTIDTLVQLRTKLEHHNSSTFNPPARWFGIDAMKRKVVDIYSQHVIEPSLVKEQIIKSAVEVTTLLIRVDDVLMAKPALYTHTHADGTRHSHAGGDGKHDHYFDKLGKRQRPAHHFY
ncbi:MAG: thermosome subunit alpha [Candidatus Nitrosopolaris sp.]|jgi:chaperonin GroEL (HSP60 family)